jgi:hypothetical protein
LTNPLPTNTISKKITPLDFVNSTDPSIVNVLPSFKSANVNIATPASASAGASVINLAGLQSNLNQ